MRPEFFKWLRIVQAAAVSFLLAASAAWAGPPLVCHPFDIGDAKSLPWVSHDWRLDGSESYDTHRLAADTVALLDQNPKVTLVHMETLRRATLYARKDPQAAKQLLLRLTARAEAAQNLPHPDPLTVFDSGYLAETYKQWLGEGGQNPASGLNGYALVKKALELTSGDPQMEFAAALITLSGPEAEREEHAAKAIAGAKTDKELARNLATHFLGPESQTMAEMITRNHPSKADRP
jgi:hypothetical protein